MDAGYAGKKFANSVSKILGCTAEVVRRCDMHILRLFSKDGL